MFFDVQYLLTENECHYMTAFWQIVISFEVFTNILLGIYVVVSVRVDDISYG